MHLTCPHLATHFKLPQTAHNNFTTLVCEMGRFANVFLVFMLLTLMGIGPMVGEARICESQSQRFKGPCVSNTNCASVCHTEGFPGGNCRGFRRRCFCTKPC